MTSWWEAIQRELRPVMPGVRAGVYASAGAPYHHAALVALWGGIPRMISANAIRQGALEQLDVLIVPGGGLRAMSGQLEPLGEDGTRAIRDWVAQGGMYIGSCAGSHHPARVSERFKQHHPAVTHLHMVNAFIVNSTEEGIDGLASPGVGVLNTQVSEASHWLARELPEHFEIVHYNGPCFLPAPGADAPELGMATGVTRLNGATSRFTPWEACLNSRETDFGLQRFISQGAYNTVTAPFGEGQVVLFGSHPEFGFDALQLGWGEAVRLFANALAFQATRRSATPITPSATVSAELNAVLTSVSTQLQDVALRFTRLADLSLNDWLAGHAAPAFLGLDAAGLWTESLRTAAQAAEETARYTLDLATSSTPLSSWAAWLQQEAEAGQDYGFVGLAPLVRELQRLLDVGEQALQQPPMSLTGPYDAWDRHPYHLLASSYLSAAGLCASAVLCATTLGALAGSNTPLPVSLFALERNYHDQPERHSTLH